MCVFFPLYSDLGGVWTDFDTSVDDPLLKLPDSKTDATDRKWPHHICYRNFQRVHIFLVFTKIRCTRIRATTKIGHLLALTLYSVIIIDRLWYRL